MRVVAVVLAFAALAPSARAEEAKAPVKASKKAIVLGPIDVNGKREVPIGIVIHRDERVKQDLDKATEVHLETVTDRH